MAMNTSASPMLWNFEEPLSGESADSLGTTSSVGSGPESDPLSLILASMGGRPIVAPLIPPAPMVLGNLGGGIASTVAPPGTPPIKEQMVKCPLCAESFRQPKVLACFHSFCACCLERRLEESLGGAEPNVGGAANRIECPLCGVDTFLSPQLGVDGLLSDYGLENAVSRAAAEKKGAGAEEKELIFGSPSSTSSSPPLGRMSSDGGGDALQKASGCTGCKSGEAASAYCGSCSHYLCANCTMAHRYMHCFEGHAVKELVVDSSSADSGNDSETSKVKRPPNASSHCKCLEHRSQPLRFFCLTCNLAVCEMCTVAEHTAPAHQVESIDSVAGKQIELMEALLVEARNKQSELHELFRLIDAGQNRLNASFQQAQGGIDEASQCLVQMISEARKVLLRELETNFGCKQLQLTLIDKEVQRMTKKMSQTITFTQRLLKYSSPTELMVFKPLLDSRLQGFLSFNADGNNLLHTSCEVEVRPLPVPQARQAIYGLMNSLRSESWQVPAVQPHPFGGQQQMPAYPYQQQQQQQGATPPVGHPFAHAQMFQEADAFGGAMGSPGHPFAQKSAAQMIHQHHHQQQQHQQQQHLGFGANAFAIGSSAPAGAGLLASEMLLDQSSGGGNTIFSQYEKWSSGMDPSSLGALSLTDPDAVNDLSILAGSVDKLRVNNSAVNGGSFNSSATNNNGGGGGGGGGNGQYPPRSQIKRLKMSYHLKLGEFGVMEGQFTEPSGVAVNAQNDIVVADTNNHRIQVFDKEGRFKFQFGECGKRDGQLLYPNRVAVNKTTGDFIVTERSPTHQLQIYNQYGQFLRKFGSSILQHPRGVCVDHQGRIVVVECKVMRVIIFSTHGEILQKFSCSRYLEFPNAVCTTEREEILISDNRAHCVKVFNYQGEYLRQIGGEGITNYPIGVGITKEGEVLVADNHSSFNITLFNQDGALLSALESKVKHAQCFDVALMEDGSVVVASKDYRLYLYRYAQQQQEPLPQYPYIGMS